MRQVPKAKFRVRQAMAKATKCTANLTGMPRGGGMGNQVEDGAELVIEAKQVLEAVEEELSALRYELAPYIQRLDKERERKMMHLRYMEGVSVRRIAMRLIHAESYVFEVLRMAERKIKAME